MSHDRQPVFHVVLPDRYGRGIWLIHRAGGNGYLDCHDPGLVCAKYLFPDTISQGQMGKTKKTDIRR